MWYSAAPPTPAEMFAQVDTNLDQEIDLNELLTFIANGYSPTMTEAEKDADKAKNE